MLIRRHRVALEIAEESFCPAAHRAAVAAEDVFPAEVVGDLTRLDLELEAGEDLLHQRRHVGVLHEAVGENHPMDAMAERR